MLTELYLNRLHRVDPYRELWRDDKKFVEHRVGLYATLFFEHVDPSVHSNEAVREALIECWHDYWRVVGPEHQHWIYEFSMGVQGFKVPSTKVPAIDEFLRDPGNFDNYQYYVHGGKYENDASEYLYNLGAFDIYDAPEYQSELGYLQIQAPFDWITSGQSDRFVALVKRCAERLKVNQAHGGLGFLRTYNEESTTRRTEFQLSKIFSGVDVDVPYVQLGGVFKRYEPSGIDSPHWLNFINDDWVRKLGGIDHLRQQLPEEYFTLEEYDGGVFIQAGSYPEPGHVSDGLPFLYVYLNKVLLPIRAPRMVYCFGDTPGELATYQGAQEYFQRFDKASSELDLSAHLNEPARRGDRSSGDSIVKLSCDGGQPCPRSGFWFTPAKEDSYRHFDAGEIMPSFKSGYGLTIWEFSAD